MGENVQQANEFDQVLKQMADGEYPESSVDPIPVSERVHTSMCPVGVPLTSPCHP